MSKVLSYKEKVVDTLYRKDYSTKLEDGREFPTNRIKVEKIEYSGKTEDNLKNEREFSGTKIRISNTKMTLKDGEPVPKVKIVGNRVVDEATYLVLQEDHLDDLLSSLSA